MDLDGQLTVRNVDDEIIRQLKIRAAKNGGSAEAEHREILKQALSGEKDWEAWRARAKKLREEIGPLPGDSTDIVRRYRDKR